MKSMGLWLRRRHGWMSSAGFLYALQLVNYAIPLLLLPFLIRTLGAEAYGWLAFCSAINFYFVLAIDSGINTVAHRDVVVLQNKPQSGRARALGMVVAEVACLKTVMAGVFFCALWLLIGWVAAWAEHRALFVLCFLPVLGSLTFPIWLFNALQQTRYTFVYSVIGRIVSTVLLLVFVRSDTDLLLAAGLQGAATLISGLASLRTIHVLCGHGPYTVPGPARMYSRLQRSAHLMASELSLTALANSTLAMVGVFHDKPTVGIYAVIEKSVRAALQMLTPVIQAAQPSVIAQWRSGEQRFLVRLSLAFAAAAALVAAAGVLLSPWLLMWLFGPAIAQHADWAQILSVWLGVAAMNAAIGAWWWVASNREHAYLRRVLVAVLLQLALFLTALSLMSLDHALWAWTLGEALLLLLLVPPVLGHARGQIR